MNYATNTSVSIDRSKAEIEKTLTKYGASAFAYFCDGPIAVIGFKISGRMVKITLPLPDKADRAFLPKRLRYNQNRAEKIQENWEQACRSSWRSLNLVIKAKLEAVASKISTVEREFFADIVLPNGKTLGQWAEPQIEDAYKSGKMPALLGMNND